MRAAGGGRAAVLAATALLLVGLLGLAAWLGVQLAGAPSPVPDGVLMEARAHGVYAEPVPQVTAECWVASALPARLRLGPLAKCAAYGSPALILGRARAFGYRPNHISLATVRVVNDCGGNPYCLPTPVLAQQVAWLVEVDGPPAGNLGTPTLVEPDCRQGATLLVMSSARARPLAAVAWGAVAGLPRGCGPSAE